MIFCTFYNSDGNNLKKVVSKVPLKEPRVLMTDPSNCFKLRLLFLNLDLPIFSQKFLGIKVTSLPMSTCMAKVMPFNFTVSIFCTCSHQISLCIFSRRFYTFYSFYSLCTQIGNRLFFYSLNIIFLRLNICFSFFHVLCYNICT